MIKVSIIIPTYNGARYIAEAIESAVDQTFKDLEIIVVDDGSTDNTKKIVEKYAQKDSRIKYYYKPNGGVGSACNFGIDKAAGDYIAYFEHDDISCPYRVEEQVRILEERPGVSFVYSSLEVFRNDSDKTVILSSDCPENADKETLFKYLLFHNALFANPSIMFRKSITAKIKYDETLPKGLGHDFLFFLKASQEYEFFKVKKPLVRWRRGHGSLSSGPPNIASDRLVIKKLYEESSGIKIPYRYALSMLLVREGRVLVDLKSRKDRYLSFFKCLAKAFYYAPHNLAIYKTFFWLFTKRLFRKPQRVLGGTDEQSFICVSSTRWGGKWERMQQLSTALSKRAKVLYLDPVISIKETKDFIKNVLGLIAPLKFLSEKNVNLFTFPLVAILPFGRIGFVKKINYYFIKRAINALKKELNLSDGILIIWDFWEGLDFIGILDKKTVIFDYFDNYLGYHDYSLERRNEIQKRLIDTIQKSDIVFVTAQNLYQEARKYHGNVRLLPNGVDIENYLGTADVSEIGKELPRPVIGYMGGNNFSTCGKIDYDLLDFVTDRMKEVSFLFIGPLGSHKINEKLEKIKQRKNVFFVGQKDPKELPSWLKKCAVFILPWKINAFTESVYPLKLNEYFSCGKPIVSTYLASLGDINKNGQALVYLADGYDNFLDMLGKALKENDSNLESKRISIAKENSWDKRADDILVAVESFLNKG